MRPLRRVLSVATAIAAVVVIAPVGSLAQEPAQPAADLRVDKRTLLLENRFQVKVEWKLTFGVFTAPQPPAGSGQPFYFLSDDNLDLIAWVLTQSPCFPERPFVFCPLPPVSGYVIKLGPLDDKLKIRAEVPKLPEKSVVNTGAGDDKVKGGQSDEKINTGKGNDNANPGKGKDDVNLGAGNDKANTKDGQPDTVNGGKGKDTAVVDKKDKVKNVEVVKRK